jgi:hypothetical protein
MAKKPSCPGLPDGILSSQKSKFWSIWQGLAMKDVGIFRAILTILRTDGILWPFGTLCGIFFLVLVC